MSTEASKLAEEVLAQDAKDWGPEFDPRPLEFKVNAALPLATALIEAQKERDSTWERLFNTVEKQRDEAESELAEAQKRIAVLESSGIAKRLKQVEDSRKEVIADRDREEHRRLDLELEVLETRNRIAELVKAGDALHDPRLDWHDSPKQPSTRTTST